MTTAYFKNTNTRRVIAFLLFFNFKFVILPEHFIKGTAKRSSYKEHIGNALALNADEGRG